MLNKGDIVEITVESLAHGGEGIGKVEGMTVFIPETLPGDKVSAKVISLKKTYARALVQEIIEPSSHRIKPFCGLAKVCGGCQIQHIDYKEQLNLKRKIVEDNLKKLSGIDIEVRQPIETTKNTGYRCKVQYPIQQTKVSKRFLAGYYKKGTHEIVNIKHCPIQPKIIDVITAFLRNKAQELGLTAYNEKTHKGLIRHFVFRYSKSQNALLLIIVINDTEIPQKLNKLSLEVKKEFKQVEGVLINYNTAKSNVIMSHNMELLIGNDFIEETLDEKKFKISAESFFQVNPETATKMFNIVRDIVKERTTTPKILDVYSGVGTFTIWLQDIASKIVAIEENPNAVKDAKENILLNNIPNQPEINIIEANADTALAELASQEEKFDVIILDPPRKGCTNEALESIIKLDPKYIVYVSCDPATLARDLKVLNSNGFIPEFVQPVDMFSHTYHIESIVVLKR